MAVGEFIFADGHGEAFSARRFRLCCRWLWLNWSRGLSVRRGVFLFVLLVLAFGAPAHATELIMFDDTTCSWCRKWMAETGPGYPRSPEGKRAPLRRVMLRDQSRIGIALSAPVTGTPTFIVVDGGREKGRIVGYLATAAFYERLGSLLDERAPTERAESRGSLGDLMRKSLGSKP